MSRTTEPAEPVLQALARENGLERCGLSFATVVEVALQETWTGDPFDRIAVAQSRLGGAPLLTKDRHIHDHFDGAVWGDDEDNDAAGQAC